MISKQEVKHIAILARLGLTEKEIDKMEKELSSILAYVDKLKEVDVENVKPTSHPILVENVMREDKAKKEDLKRVSELFKAAPGKEKGYVKVKTIL